MKTCIRCRVSGRVQGVFFRARTRERALSLGLTGWVRNLANGDVEVLACGPQEQVAKLREWLWQGPELARVSAVRCQKVEVEDLEGFEIRY